MKQKISKTPKEHQMSIFEVAQESFIDMNHELVLLANQIDWEAVESEFAEYYCADNGRPSVPIRKMVGMMLLKNIYNLSDEGVVARWMENPYMQYFTGEKVFKIRLMAAAAYNMMHWMNRNALASFVSWLLTLVRRLENVIFENVNKSARLCSTLAMVAWRGV